MMQMCPLSLYPLAMATHYPGLWIASNQRHRATIVFSNLICVLSNVNDVLHNPLTHLLNAEAESNEREKKRAVIMFRHLPLIHRIRDVVLCRRSAAHHHRHRIHPPPIPRYIHCAHHRNAPAAGAAVVAPPLSLRPPDQCRCLLLPHPDRLIDVFENRNPISPCCRLSCGPA